MKECKKCHETKSLSEYYTAKSTKDGLMTECKSCNKKKVQTYRNKTGYDEHRGHYNFRRIFRQRYHSMKRRIDGTRTRKSGKRYPVYGKELLSVEEFLEWCYKPEVYASFEILYEAWKTSGFKFKLSPSIDRIDNDKGYSLDNIQWLSHIDNRIKWNT